MEDMTKDIQAAIQGLISGKIVRVYINGDMLKVKQVFEDEHKVVVLSRGRETTIDLPGDYAFAIYEAL